MENMSTEELRERAALIAKMRADLEAIEELALPTEHEIRTASGYREDLEAIEELTAPDENEIRAAAAHREDLEVIEEHAV